MPNDSSSFSSTSGVLSIALGSPFSGATLQAFNPYDISIVNVQVRSVSRERAMRTGDENSGVTSWRVPRGGHDREVERPAAPTVFLWSAVSKDYLEALR